MIPRLLHQVWIGPRPPPQRLMDTWKTLNPTWEYRLWGNDAVGWENQDAIDMMAEWNGKADIMRYEILRNHGGVVADADSECIQPLDDSFRHHDSFACFENEDVRPGLIACGAIGSVPHCRLMEKCVELIPSRWLLEPAWRSVGPLFFTQVARGYPGLYVYPARTFIPVHFTGRAAPGDAPIFARQYWGSTKGYDNL